jgi:hydroxymethylbilane synthase
MSGGSRRLRIGTRASPLALIQAREVAGRLGALGVGVELVTFRTSGDLDAGRPLAELESPAPFTDVLDEALLSGAVDLAVHSLKDLPLEGQPGLLVAAVPVRASVGEALVSRDGVPLAGLRPGARVGTSCQRRALQIRRLRPDLLTVAIRGAAESRVRQVHEGRYDATVLATAGLERLGLEHVIAQRFSLHELGPAPGQGALAVVTRVDDAPTLRAVGPLDDVFLRSATDAERTLQRELEAGGTHVLAAAARVGAQGLELAGRLIDAADARAWDVRVSGSSAAHVAQAAAARLREALAPAA